MGVTGASRGTLDFRSPPGGNVQGRLQLRLDLADHRTAPGTHHEEEGDAAAEPAVSVAVPRASVRFRFPVTEEYSLRITAGRDRLSWGLGALFNSADLLFGADGRADADFTRAGDVRDETAWLLSLYFPVGELGYVETVALPPPGTPGSYNELRGGLRAHGVVGPVSVEPSWLYDGTSDVHRLALALQGTLGADIYGAASAHLPHGGDPTDGELLLSTGALYMMRIGRDHTLSLRLEGLVRPQGAWSDREDREAVYAVLLYPEITWGAGPVVQVFSRGLVSPLDRSTSVITGTSWNIFQGFHALAFASTEIGSDTALYGWDRPGSASVSVGFRYLF